MPPPVPPMPSVPSVPSMGFIFLLLLIAIGLTVTGELFLKLGVNQVGVISPSLSTFIRTFTEWRIILGFALTFSGGLFWLGVISRVDFSFAYPLLAMSYIIGLIPARFVLGENVTLNRIIGTLIIVSGVVVMTWHEGSG